MREASAAGAVAAPRRTGKKTLGQKLWAMRAGYLMVAPLMIGILIFCYYPPVAGILLSFTNKTSTTPMTFIGIRNFRELFADEVFLHSIPTMLEIMLPRLVIGIVMPLVAAELVFAVRSARMQTVYRVLLLLPIVAPGVVNLLIWRNIYDANSGLMTELVRLFGLAGEAGIDWLGDPRYVIFSIIFMGFPWVGGTSVLIYMSGLVNMSTEVIEASRLDGASTFRRILRIDLPLLVGQIRYFLIFGLIGGFQDYGTQIILTQGGPGYSTYVPGYYMFELMYTHDNMGKAAAVGTLLFVVIMIFTVIAFRFGKSEDAL